MKDQHWKGTSHRSEFPTIRFVEGRACCDAASSLLLLLFLIWNQNGDWTTHPNLSDMQTCNYCDNEGIKPATVIAVRKKEILDAPEAFQTPTVKIMWQEIFVSILTFLCVCFEIKLMLQVLLPLRIKYNCDRTDTHKTLWWSTSVWRSAHGDQS